MVRSSQRRDCLCCFRSSGRELQVDLAQIQHHTVADDKNASAGQVGEESAHDSAISQSPATGRQTSSDCLIASAGHAVEEPLRVSSRSQVPAAVRHTMPASLKVLSGGLMV